MGDVISDHISELLGGQGQPLVDEDSEGLEYEGQEGDGGGEPPSLESDTTPPGESEPPAPQAGKRQKVPLAALQEERTKRQNLETQLQQVQQHNQTMEQRFQQMVQLMQQQNASQQQQQQQQQEPAAMPTFLDDPEGYVNALRDQFQQQVQQLQQENQQLMQARQQQTVVQELAQRSATYEDAFKAQNPDYPQAVEFFAQRKAAEYAALGANQFQIQQQIQIDVARVAQLSLQQNKDPAQQMYALATALGYTKAAPVPPKPGAKPAPQAALPPKAPTSLATVESTVRSPDEGQEMTLEAVAHMSDAEFDKYWAKMARGSVQRPKF